MKFLITLVIFASTIFAFNLHISDSTVANGKTTIIEFTKEKNIGYKKVILGKKVHKIYQHPLDASKMYALIPISYYEKPSDKKVKIIYTDKGKEKNKIILLYVEDGKYKQEKIKVQKSKVTLNKKDKKRASIEYAQAMKIYSASTPKNLIHSKFIAPMDSKITSSFGKARVYNETLNGYHSGTDYRAKVGTPIKASNDGIVVLVKDRFYSGGTVILDHGRGIYTCYYHMSDFNVKKGQKIKKADVIGLSGVSGRVTGPHLHFSARVGGEQVDPLQLIDLLNKKLF
ncbi:M23 family metallopeptidase [Sulfurimonas sp.]|uniref:M23 family metallopeptidase n=1 Tax=Sulfurimonas sp. TaxID=2022749 RepID=UPI0025EB965D|nr:M23 family metallopeptidase [Sulfurimonas sp.]